MKFEAVMQIDRTISVRRDGKEVYIMPALPWTANTCRDYSLELERMLNAVTK
jgi:hypothetical protein